MSRINDEQFFADLKKVEVEAKKSKVREKTKRSKFRSGCLFSAGFFPIFFIIVCGAVLAKAGIWEIPVFSKVFYRTPQPIRIVKIKNPAEYANKTPNSSYDQTTKTYQLELTEDDITFMIQQSLAKQSEPTFAPNAQVAITEKEIEFFGFLLKPFKANLTIRIVPIFANNKIDFKLTKFKVGDLSLPPRMVDWSIRKYSQFRNKNDNKLTPDLLKQVELYRDKIKPDGIKLQAGKIIIGIFIDAEKFQQSIDQQMRDNVKKMQALDLNDPTVLEKLKSLNIDPKIVEKIKEINIDNTNSSILEQILKLQPATQ